MRAKRRNFITAVGCGCLSAGVVGRARAAQSVRVQAEFRSAVGASLEGHQIEFISNSGSDVNFHKTYIEDGRIDLILQGGMSYKMTFFKETDRGSLEFNDIPLVYGLENELTIQESATDLGVFEIPDGHLVDIRIEDLDGHPVKGLKMGFRGSTGSGTGSSHVTTTDGLIRYKGNAETGIVLSGKVEVEIREEFMTADRLTVTEPQEFVIPVREPEQYGGTIQNGSTKTETEDTVTPGEGTPTDTPEPVETQQVAEPTEPDTSMDTSADDTGDQTQRGFLTNDPESSVRFLNDPVRLTWAGIAASILGMVAQLIGRQS